VELKDYLAVVRRRWLVILVVFVVLWGAATGYFYAAEKPAYTAAARIGVREGARPFTPADLQILQFDLGGYNYYTKEALVTSRQVYDLAGAICLAVEGRSFRTPQDRKRWWRADESESELAQWMKERGVVEDVQVRDGRIVLIKLNEEKIASASGRLRAVAAAKPDDRVQLIRLSTSSGSSDEAQLLVNCMAKAAVIHSRVEALDLLDKGEQRMAKRRVDLETDVAKLVEKLGPVAEQLKEMDRRVQVLTERQYEIEKGIEAGRTRLEQVRARVRDYTRSHHQELGPIPGLAEDEGLTSPLLERLRGDLISLRTDLAIRGINWKPTNPEYVRLRERYNQLENEFREEQNRARSQAIRKLLQEEQEIQVAVQNLEQARQARRQELEQVRTELRDREPDRRRLDTLTQEQTRLGDIKSRIDSARALYQGYYTFEEVAEAAETSPAKWPRSSALFAVVALVMALAAAFLFEYADSNIYSDYDLRRHLNVPCIGLVEDVGRGSPLILRASPRDPGSENFNMIATVIRSYLSERNFRTLTVCSAVPREGKTTIACNLAVAMARKGIRVGLVDSDLRIPQIHEIFSLSNNVGLSTVLRGEIPAETDPESYFAPCPDVPNLWILPSGPTPDSPVQLLESPAMVEFLKSAREKFDVIVLDTPPITRVADTLSMAKVVDTNLFVIGAGLSNRRVATWAKQLLGNVRADVCGAVLNFARARQGATYYYYYYTPAKQVRSRE
jgi:capsular exopolysaccharide synthesis family protein